MCICGSVFAVLRRLCGFMRLKQDILSFSLPMSWCRKQSSDEMDSPRTTGTPRKGIFST